MVDYYYHVSVMHLFILFSGHGTIVALPSKMFRFTFERLSNCCEVSNE